MKVKVERDGRAEEVMDLHDLVADVKRNESEAARHQDSAKLCKDFEELFAAEVHDRIKRDDAGEHGVSEIERDHVANAEFDRWMQSSRDIHHTRGQVDPDDMRAALVKVAGHMSRPASKIRDQ